MKDLRERCEKLARRYFDKAGLKNDESKALFKMDLESFAREIRQPLLDALNEIDHVMNWNADHICRCFTNENPRRNPNCQYHRIEEITRAALKTDALAKESK